MKVISSFIMMYGQVDSLLLSDESKDSEVFINLAVLFHIVCRVLHGLILLDIGMAQKCIQFD